jgi:hypothetical protein
MPNDRVAVVTWITRVGRNIKLNLQRLGPARRMPGELRRFWRTLPFFNDANRLLMERATKRGWSADHHHSSQRGYKDEPPEPWIDETGARRKTPVFSKRLRRKAMAEQGWRLFVVEQAADDLPATPLTPAFIAWITTFCCTSSGGTEDHLRSTVRPAPTRGYPAQEQWN